MGIGKDASGVVRVCVSYRQCIVKKRAHAEHEVREQSV